MRIYKDMEKDGTFDYVVEFWGSSTKHPDSVHRYNNDVEKKKFIPSEFYDGGKYDLINIWQWLVYVASTKTFCFHCKELMEELLELYPIVINGEWKIEELMAS